MTMLAELTKVFNSIYSRKFWGTGTNSSPLSGTGSNPVNAAPYVNFIRHLVDKYSISSVLDIGHGDWQMWGNYDFEGIKYFGIDVSDAITQMVNSKYGNATRHFLCIDITDYSDQFSVDMVISKDCLQHLPNANIKSILASVQNFPTLVLCNDIFVDFDNYRDLVRWHLAIRIRLSALLSCKNPLFKRSRSNNMDIAAGDFRGIDLEELIFEPYLSNFRLIEKFDFDGPKRSGIKKRVYLYRKNI